MASMASFVRGHDVLTMNHTPVAAIAAGDVVVVGDIPAICVRPIAADELGGLNIGGGTYKVKGDAAIAKGLVVYWVVASSKVTVTPGSNKYFGIAVEACTGDNDEFEVAHRPAMTPVAVGS